VKIKSRLWTGGSQLRAVRQPALFPLLVLQRRLVRSLERAHERLGSDEAALGDELGMGPGFCGGSHLGNSGNLQAQLLRAALRSPTGVTACVYVAGLFVMPELLLLLLLFLFHANLMMWLESKVY